MEHTTAVFHQEERMNEALRDLADHGIGDEREVVPPQDVPAEHPPQSFFGLSHRVVYAGFGAGIGAIAGMGLSGSPSGSPLATIWLVLAGAVMGSLLGGLLGLAIGGYKRQIWIDRAPEKRWMVRVDTSTHEDADRAALTLESYGATIMHLS